MNTIELLGQSAPGLASLITDARASAFRRVATVVARAVVAHTGLSHPVVDRALDRLDTAPMADANLQASVQAAAEELDGRYFSLKEALEEREDAGKADPQDCVCQSTGGKRRCSSTWR